MPSRPHLLLPWVLLAGFCLTARGEQLTFLAGDRITLPATVAADRVQVEAPWGRSYTFPRSDFRRIGADPWPAEAWSEREAAAVAGGTETMRTAALWALDHGLVREATALLRTARATDPGDAGIARLVGALDQAAVPLPAPDLSKLHTGLPDSFVVAESPHITLLHQHSEPEARQRLDLLETVYSGFLLELARLGLEVPSPRTRLVSVWFSDRLDYLAYLKREGATAHLTTRGYCHPTRPLALSYDARSDTSYRRRRANLDAGRERLGAGEGAGAGVASRELDRLELVLELEWRQLDRGTAAHELVHLLVRETRLEPRPGAFPIWLHEGLAMQFEAIAGDGWAGLASPPPERLAKARTAVRPGALEPLLQDANLRAGYRAEAYGQAWSLVYTLRVHDPVRFTALIDALRLAPVDSDPRTVGTESLRKSFGATLDPLRREWGRTVVAASQLQ